ncbi:hypothetical protein bcere0019_53620 [Bacillus cereus Rock3-28]|nr:hypothetical protein bcere0019_53620 [Bacillus cereus Rock3-28]
MLVIGGEDSKKKIMKSESNYIKAQGLLREIKERIESEKRSEWKM